MSKKQVNSNIDLNALCGGAFAEKVNEALVPVGENIQNMNTDATKKRKITVTMTFAPNKSRQLVSTQIDVTTTLAATEAVETQMVMGVNMRTGQLEIAEYDGQIRGQMSFEDLAPKAEPDPEQEAPEVQQSTPDRPPVDLRRKRATNASHEQPFDPETGEIFEKPAKVVAIAK